MAATVGSGRGGLLVALTVLAGCRAEPVGFDTPESVAHDTVDDVFLVSNIHGEPLAKDGNGYISRVRPDGSCADRHWIQGGRDGVVLNAPKGLALAGDVLWVADIDCVRTFDRRTGKPLGEVAIPAATFLNDVAIAPDGTVYVSDSGLDANFAATGTDAIWCIGEGGLATKRISGPELGQPNGLFANDSGVYVVGWRDGAFYQIDTKGRRTDLGTAPKAKLDGLIRVEGKDVPVGFYATSWEGQCIYRFSLQGDCITMQGGPLAEPADGCFDATRGRIVVPLFGRGELAFLPVATR